MDADGLPTYSLSTCMCQAIWYEIPEGSDSGSQEVHWQQRQIFAAIRHKDEHMSPLCGVVRITRWNSVHIIIIIIIIIITIAIY
jgi:t-SNARE complex subunit (syntaxin)